MLLRNLPRGTEVMCVGDSADSLLIVVSGRLRVSTYLPSGEIKLINELGPGDSVGELGLVLNQPRKANVTTVRDSTVALLHRKQYEALLSAHPLPIGPVMD